MRLKVILTVAIALAVAFPATAISARMRLFGLPVCNSATACTGASNDGTGPGLEGTASTGDAIEAFSQSGEGLYANSAAQGVVGVSTSSGIGVQGWAFGSPTAGVEGIAVGSSNTWGPAVAGLVSGYGGTALFGSATNGATGASVRSDTGYGLAVQTASHWAPATYVQINDPTGEATLMTGVNLALSDPNVFEISGNGTVFGAGFECSGTCPAMKVHQKTARGPSVVTYSDQASMPSLEDDGEATLVHGQTSVRFDDRLASTMEPGTRYLVFITPQGPPRGTLYVAEKTQSGFAVRDTAPDLAPLTFDYRIVVRPLGTAADRLPTATTLSVTRRPVLPDLRIPKYPRTREPQDRVWATRASTSSR